MHLLLEAAGMHLPLVVGPPQNVDPVAGRLEQLRLHRPAALAERGVDVHRLRTSGEPIERHWCCVCAREPCLLTQQQASTSDRSYPLQEAPAAQVALAGHNRRATDGSMFAIMMFEVVTHSVPTRFQCPARPLWDTLTRGAPLTDVRRSQDGRGDVANAAEPSDPAVQWAGFRGNPSRRRVVHDPRITSLLQVTRPGRG